MKRKRTQCPYQPEVQALRDGEMPSSRATQIQEHLVGCPLCRREWEELSRLSTLLKEGDRAIPLSPEERERMKQALLSICERDLAGRRQEGRSPFSFVREGGRNLKFSFFNQWLVGIALATMVLAFSFWGRSLWRNLLPSKMAFRASKEVQLLPPGGRGKVNQPLVSAGLTPPRGGKPLGKPQGSKDHSSVSALLSSLGEFGRKEDKFLPPHFGRVSKPSVAASSRRESLQRKALIPLSEQNVSSQEIIDDLAYLNSSSSLLSGRDTLGTSFPPSMEPSLPHSSQEKRGDDFVTIPLPTLALVEASGTDPVITQALKEYERQKAISDARLYRKITVRLKGVSLADAVTEISQQTGVKMSAHPNCADDKITIFVKEVPARDLMRQIARLFNYQWQRWGEEPDFRYQLVAPLEQILKEEDLRRQADNRAFLAVDRQMQEASQYLDWPSEKLEAMARDAEQQARSAGSIQLREQFRRQAQIFRALATPYGKAGVRLYHILDQNQLQALRNGQPVVFSNEDSNLGQKIPEGILDTLKGLPGLSVFRPNSEGKWVKADIRDPNLTVKIILSLDQRPEGRVELKVTGALEGEGVLFTTSDQFQLPVGLPLGRISPGQGAVATTLILATGEDETIQNPENARVNAYLASEPGLKTLLSLHPSAEVLPASPPSSTEGEILKDSSKTQKLTPRETSEKTPDKVLTSAEVFEALHQKAGLNVVADYFTRLYPEGSFIFTDIPLFDLLNRCGDNLGMQWTKDSDFYRFRSLNYFYLKPREVPHRLVKRWKEAMKEQGYLTLDHLSEIASLTELQKTSEENRRAAEMLWGIGESWDLAIQAQKLLQFYRALDPVQRQKATSTSGLFLIELTSQQKESLFSALNLKLSSLPSDKLMDLEKTGVFQVHYREPGWYEWVNYPMGLGPNKDLPFVRFRSRERARVEEAIRAKGGNPENLQEPELAGPDPGLWFVLRTASAARICYYSPKGSYITARM